MKNALKTLASKGLARWSDKSAWQRTRTVGMICAPAALLIAASCASSSEDEELQLATTSQAVQSVWVASSETATNRGVNLVTTSSQSRKGKSTGALFYKSKDNSIPSCGVTFISHQYALTAAHCVPKEDITLSTAFTVEQYDTRNLSMSAFAAQTQVNGTWPDYYRPNVLNSSVGYNVTRYLNLCKVVRRCHNTYGRDNCPFTDSIDLAMLRCIARPLSGQNWVPVAASDSGTQNVEVWWFHEVLNLATDASTPYAPYQPNFNWYHYGKYTNPKTDNYHYWHHTPPDTDRQLLPLLSRQQPNGVRYHGNGHTGTTTTKSTVPVCHGTSGSGVFAGGTDNFLGVVALFGPNFSGEPLCDSIGTSSEATRMEYTQATWARAFEKLSEVQNDRQ